MGGPESASSDRRENMQVQNAEDVEVVTEKVTDTVELPQRQVTDPRLLDWIKDEEAANEALSRLREKKKGSKEKKGKEKPFKFKKSENVFVKLPAHELCVEMQLFYKDLTEACVGLNEKRRIEALGSLSYDPSVIKILPRLCTFIAEGVRVNVIQRNLSILIYLMRMVKSLLNGEAVSLENYLHQIVPSVLTCIVCEQLCARPEKDNHWVLRDFSSKLMAQMCNDNSRFTANLKTRVVTVLSSALSNESAPLTSLYGALSGLSELGTEVIKDFILPNIPALGSKLQPYSEQGSSGFQTDYDAAQRIKILVIIKSCPVIKSMRKSPDELEEYKAEFGNYFAVGLYLGVGAIRSVTASTHST